jgi:lysozyme
MIDVKAYITKHEAECLNAYKDSLGIWTMGVGFNIERSGADEAMRNAGVNPDVIRAAIEEAKKAGKDKTPELIDKRRSQALLQADVLACQDDLHKLFPKFDAMPEEARTVLLDMRFQLGPSRLRGFANTLKAFADGRWRDAGAGIKSSMMYKQVSKRCDENIALLLSIK